MQINDNLTGRVQTQDEAAAQALREGNPIVAGCAHAGYEAIRAFAVFTGKLATPPWGELPKDAKQDIIDDTFQCMAGAKPQEIYSKYDHGGILWDAAFPDVQLRYVLFVRVVMDVFASMSALANAGDDVVARANDLSGPRGGAAQ